MYWYVQKRDNENWTDDFTNKVINVRKLKCNCSTLQKHVECALCFRYIYADKAFNKLRNFKNVAFNTNDRKK